MVMTSASRFSAPTALPWQTNETVNTTVVGNPSGFHSSRIPHFFMQRYAPCYVEEVKQFIECVREDKPAPVTGVDGRMAVVLGMAANKSLKENRPVKISEISGK